MKGAIFSDDRRYRYALYRQVAQAKDSLTANEKVLNFIGLNPSTADEEVNDPTVRRCIGFARSWGYTQLVVTNIYAYRSTDPAGLRSVADPVGPENDRWLRLEAKNASLVIAAWSGHAPVRSRQVAVALDDLHLYCLGLTRDGFPRHPLYMAAATQPARFIWIPAE